MKKNDPIYIGENAIDHLVDYLNAHGLTRFTLVADENTHAALGKRVDDALRAQNGYDVTTLVLTGEEIIADAHYLLHVLANSPVAEQVFIAVGSGTITDICRFASHRSKNNFIAMPTAPSVDGFTSVGAPLVLAGVKQTLNCQPPLAVFADLPTLQQAPKRLIAAGFGDIVGKYTSLADWELGRLLWNEPYDANIAERARAGLHACVRHADEISSASADGIRYLMDSLVESGLCMLELGSSRPASGSEHHCSHYWEMMLLQEGRPALLHGAKVGFATTLMIEQYGKIRAMSRQEMLDRLEAAELPDRDAEIAAIRQAYGDGADGVISAQAAFLDLPPEAFDQLKHRIAAHWDEIQAIAAALPTSDDVVASLKQVGTPTSAEELGLTADEVRRARQYGHYLRDRFTVMKLSRVLDLALTGES
jgi:glycerol-1-phosphate dehydrogenase [NAD(P)+]